MKLYSIALSALLALLICAGTKDATAAEKGKITKPKGGYTVEEIYAKKDKLDGKKVTVRGRVVKFSAGIMGRNWIHLQDGTGKPGSNDLTVTTDRGAKAGDIVTVTGVLAKDRNFGAGYKYSVIIEEAEVKVEK